MTSLVITDKNGMVKRAQQEPQQLTSHGKPSAVVLSAEAYDRHQHEGESLVAIIRRSPLGPAIADGPGTQTGADHGGLVLRDASLVYRLLDNSMQVVSFSEARGSFKAVLDRVEADADVTLITRRHAKGAVVMSLDTYNSLMETVHLLRSPANAAHLQQSLEQAGRGELLSHELLDPDLADAED